jgi:hypothetical protein
MSRFVHLLSVAFLMTFGGLGAARADIKSMLLVVCEPNAPYFSIETLTVETDADLGLSALNAPVSGDVMRPLRSMVDRPIECMVGKRKVQATLTEFYEPNVRRALEAANIVITIDGVVAAELHATHRKQEWNRQNRARVEVSAFLIQTCESTSDEELERYPPDPMDHERRVLLCNSKFLPRP